MGLAAGQDNGDRWTNMISQQEKDIQKKAIEEAKAQMEERQKVFEANMIKAMTQVFSQKVATDNPSKAPAPVDGSNGNSGGAAGSGGQAFQNMTPAGIAASLGPRPMMMTPGAVRPDLGMPPNLLQGDGQTHTGFTPPSKQGKVGGN